MEKNQRKERREAKRTPDRESAQEVENTQVVIKVKLCSVDGRPCNGECRKSNSTNGVCDCLFVF